MPFNVQFRKVTNCHECRIAYEEGIRKNDILIKVDDEDAEMESSGSLTIELLKKRSVYFSIKYAENQWIASF